MGKRGPKKGIGGRPTTLTPTAIAKLEQAYMYDANDHEACLAAGISTHALYRYQGKNPNFRERKKILKKNVTLVAKQNVLNNLENGDKDITKFVLERRDPDYQRRERIDVDNRITIRIAGWAAPKQLTDEVPEEVPEADLIEGG